MSTSPVPNTYEEWYHLITVIGGQKLTAEFIDQRIESLSSAEDKSTQQYIALYGEELHRNTLKWFKQARSYIVEKR